MAAREDLIDKLAWALGRENATKLVTDLEETIEAKASAGASKAATKVVTRGLLGAGAIGLFSILVSANLARQRRNRDG